MRGRRSAAASLVALVAMLGCAGLEEAAVAPPAAALAPAAAPVGVSAATRTGTALRLLRTLPVKGRAPKTGYSREVFGQRWADTDRNGCDTRNDILRRDLSQVTFRPGTRDCVVLSGRLADPYTARVVAFTKADGSAVHVDHVVSLSDAWQKGAQAWRPQKRLAFANDALNLLAVDGRANSAKSDGDAATWLPPNKAYRCALVARQVAVKAKYDLWVTTAERAAIERVLGTCPGQAAPTGGSPTAAAAPAPAGGSAGARQYATCTALRQDFPGGVARPGAVNVGGRTRHRSHVDAQLYEANARSDRDRDGVACEA